MAVFLSRCMHGHARRYKFSCSTHRPWSCTGVDVKQVYQWLWMILCSSRAYLLAPSCPADEKPQSVATAERRPIFEVSHTTSALPNDANERRVDNERLLSKTLASCIERVFMPPINDCDSTSRGSSADIPCSREENKKAIVSRKAAVIVGDMRLD